MIASPSREAFRDRLLERARARYGRNITYAGCRRSWDECLTFYGPVVILWFNDEAGSTHIEREQLG